MITHGSTLTEGPTSWNQKEDNSGTTTRNFSSNNQSEIVAKANELRALGYAVQVDQGPPWTLTATLAYVTIDNNPEPTPEPQWNIQASAGEQNIMESDIDIVKTLSIETKEKLLLAIKNPGKNYPHYATNASDTEKANAEKLYKYMTIGADSKRFNTVTVSRTITVSRRYVSDWDLVNVNKVLSKETLVGATNMPQWVYILLPDSAQDVEQSPGVIVNKGYLQEHPTYQNVANNQVQISQQWVYNSWLKDYYPFV